MNRAAIALAVLALAGCTSPPATPTQVTQAPTPGLTPFYGQRLDWSDCESGFECAKLEVPLDYGKTDGERIEISVVRLPASGSSRVGSILLNPGGPGGSGIAYARAARQNLSPAVLGRFDVVGFDPRGVGESTPVRCMSTSQLDAYIGLDATPDSPSEQAALVDGASRFAQSCSSRAARLLPHIGTANAARDMDILRAAVGDAGLTYLGKSYGTQLGAQYADLFPSKVRALVLDGAVDTELTPLEMNLAQARGFEVALRAFVADCVSHADCPVGRTADAGLAKIKELFRGADEQPLTNKLGDGRQVTESWVSTGVAAALYEKGAWSILRVALTQALAGDGTLLLRIADFLLGRKPEGYSNQTESNMAINCVDKPYPRSVPAYSSAARRASSSAPRFGSYVMWGSLPCAFWPSQPSASPRPLRADGAKPILVIGTTRDPATPYQWAEALAKRLSSGVLLAYNGDGHTAYKTGSACVDGAVNRYLISLEAPKDGTRCGK